MNVKVSVYRYDSTANEKARHDDFEVPYVKGMTVLDLIFYIQKHLDPTLAYRYECRQGVCGTCGLMLNGKPVLSCNTQIDASLEKQVVEPLSNFPVEKDLIANLKPVLDRYQKIKPFIEKIREVTITKKVADISRPFRKCIECGCCIAGAKRLPEAGKEHLDPMDLVKIARYLTDPRDQTDRVDIIAKSGIEGYTADEGKTLAALCPKGIPIDEAIAIVKAEYTSRKKFAKV